MEPGAHEEFRHKNRLQEFAQRASISLPVYQTCNEGTPHLPQFRSTVIVDGTTFVSPCVFLRRKQAEQFVAKFALDTLLAKIKQEGVPLINNDAVFCKAILHEYAAKMRMGLPKYTTSRVEGSLPIFHTSVVFDGKIYSGDAGRSKKEAEQLAARVVIDWIIGHSDKSIPMAEILKSKDKLVSDFRKCSDSIVLQGNNKPLTVGDHSGDAVANGLDMLGGTVEPPNNNDSVKVPLDNHSGDTVVKENDMSTLSTNGTLPVQHSVPPPAGNLKERDICEVFSGTVDGNNSLPILQKDNQPEGSAVPAAQLSVLPVAGNIKEEHICGVSGAVGGSNMLLTVQNNNQPEGSTGEPLSASSEKVIQVKEEVPSEEPPVLPSQLQTPNPRGSGKRLQTKQNRGSNSKKIRTDG